MSCRRQACGCGEKGKPPIHPPLPKTPLPWKKAPVRLIPGLADGGATALVCDSKAGAMVSRAETAFVGINGATAGGMVSADTTDTGVEVAMSTGGSAGTVIGARGGGRLVAGVPIIMSDGTLGRGGAGAATSLGTGGTGSGNGGKSGKFTGCGGKLTMQSTYWPSCECNTMMMGSRAFCRSPCRCWKT